MQLGIKSQNRGIEAKSDTFFNLILDICVACSNLYVISGPTAMTPTQCKPGLSESQWHQTATGGQMLPTWMHRRPPRMCTGRGMSGFPRAPSRAEMLAAVPHRRWRAASVLDAPSGNGARRQRDGQPAGPRSPPGCDKACAGVGIGLRRRGPSSPPPDRSIALCLKARQAIAHVERRIIQPVRRGIGLRPRLRHRPRPAPLRAEIGPAAQDGSRAGRAGRAGPVPCGLRRSAARSVLSGCAGLRAVPVGHVSRSRVGTGGCPSHRQVVQ